VYIILRLLQFSAILYIKYSLKSNGSRNLIFHPTKKFAHPFQHATIGKQLIGTNHNDGKLNPFNQFFLKSLILTTHNIATGQHRNILLYNANAIHFLNTFITETRNKINQLDRLLLLSVNYQANNPSFGNTTPKKLNRIKQNFPSLATKFATNTHSIAFWKSRNTSHIIYTKGSAKSHEPPAQISPQITKHGVDVIGITICQRRQIIFHLLHFSEILYIKYPSESNGSRNLISHLSINSIFVTTNDQYN
jgi:hypothetical protein